MIHLKNLPPGARVRLVNGKRATLVFVNDCRARIRYEKSKEVSFVVRTTGKEVSFARHKEENISPETQVEIYPWEDVQRFESSTTPGRFYTVKRRQDGVLGCDCPRFLFQRLPIEERTCPHTEAAR